MAAATTSIFLLIALCAGTAFSLKCYTCAAQSSNSNCNTATNCTSGLNYCQTTVASVALGSLSTTSITKICAATCTTYSGSLAGASSSVSCCSTDLCNTSAGTSVKYSITAIALTMGFALLKHLTIV